MGGEIVFEWSAIFPMQRPCFEMQAKLRMSGAKTPNKCM